MICALTGKVVDIFGTFVALDVGGVAYEVIASSACVSRLSLEMTATVVVYTEVKEDAIRLYGFADKLEKQAFLLLTKVKGIGPKTASDIISKADKRELLKHIAASDLAGLQSLGIGRKTAERILVELRDKVGEYALEAQFERLGVERMSVNVARDAIDALAALGFSRAEAERAITAAEKSGAVLPTSNAGEMVREALRYV